MGRVGSITVRVRFSGPLAESLGPRRAIRVDAGATVEELLEVVLREARIDGHVDALAAIAGGRFLEHSQALTDGDEVDVLVPVAGG
jgi:molybdopterin converting factor small subunit